MEWLFAPAEQFTGESDEAISFTETEVTEVVTAENDRVTAGVAKTAKKTETGTLCTRFRGHESEVA